MTRLAVPVNVVSEIDTTNNPTFYFGDAPMGATTSQAVWRIYRITVSGVVSIKWADGDSEFNNVWDDRTTLTYG